MRTPHHLLSTALIAFACGEMSLDPNPVRLDGDPTEAPDAASSPPTETPCVFERRWFSPDVEYLSLRGFFGFDAEGAQVELHGGDQQPPFYWLQLCSTPKGCANLYLDVFGSGRGRQHRC